MIHCFISNITDNISSESMCLVIIYTVNFLYDHTTRVTKREKIIGPRWLCCKIMFYYHFIKFYTNVSLFLQQCVSENMFIKLTEAWKYDS